MPAFNAGATINGLLAALARQARVSVPVEIVVVDDGSNDDTAALARSSAGVEVITQANAGPAAARNRGARAARGDILVFTDADCEPAPDWLARLTRPLLEDESVDAAKGVYRTRQRRWAARFAQLEFEGRYRLLARARHISFVDSYSAAVRAVAFRAVGGFDPHFPLADNEDVDLSFKLARAGYKMVFCPDAVVYHQHPATWRRYLALKLRRAYWRARVYRRFPEMMFSDTYTPQLLKVQVFLMAAFAPLAAAAYWWRPAAWGAAAAAALFLLTTTPFLATAVVRDPPLVLVAVPALVARAAVFAVGGAAGFLSRRRFDLLFPSLYLIGDVGAVVASVSLIYWVRSTLLTAVLQPIWHPFFIYIRAAFWVALFWVSVFAVMGLYKSARATSFMTEGIKIFRGVVLVVLVSMAASYLVKFEYSRAIMALFFAAVVPLALVERYALHALQDTMRRRGYNQTRVIVVGAGEAGHLLVERMKQYPALGYRPVGFVDDEAPSAADGQYLGTTEELCRLISDYYADEVIVAKPSLAPSRVLELVTQCDRTGAAFRVLYGALETVGGQVELKSVGDIPLVDFVDPPFRPLKRFVKRAGDLSFVLLAAPTWFVLTACVFAASLFSTRRWPLVSVTTMGLDGLPFVRSEFRVDDDAGLTRFLRRTRLYRLPWFFSVLAGTMSVVGPRPFDYEEGRRHKGWQRYRYRMKPGVTGLWLTMAGNGAPAEAELELDFYYIKNQNVLLDAAIILRTVFGVLGAPGYGAPGADRK